MTARTAALLIGVIFIAVGILGFVDNPVVGDSENVIFHADSTHNMVHLISGALFVLIALAAPALAGTFMVIFGLVYLGIGILGMINMGNESMGTVMGFLHVNGNDNYLHIGLGLVILIAGIATRKVVARN